MVEIALVEFDHLITKPKLKEGDNFMDFVNPTSKFTSIAYGEGNMRSLAQKSIIQLERRGYFYVDKVAGVNDKQKQVLHFIPDGKTKSMSGLSTQVYSSNSQFSLINLG